MATAGFSVYGREEFDQYNLGSVHVEVDTSRPIAVRIQAGDGSWVYLPKREVRELTQALNLALTVANA